MCFNKSQQLGHIHHLFNVFMAADSWGWMENNHNVMWLPEKRKLLLHNVARARMLLLILYSLCRLYFRPSHAAIWHHNGELLLRVQKVTAKRTYWRFTIRCSLLIDCMFVWIQAVISEHRLYPENHQSADRAPPRAARLLWLPYNGWWPHLICHTLTWTWLHLATSLNLSLYLDLVWQPHAQWKDNS